MSSDTFLYALVRHEGRAGKKAVYLALGVNIEGEKELPGLWIAQENFLEAKSISRFAR